MRYFAAVSAAVLMMGTATTVVSPAYAAGETCQGQPVTLVATSDYERLQGSEDADVIDTAGFDYVVVEGNGGDDVICATTGHTSTLDGGPGDDILVDLPGSKPGDLDNRTTLLGGDAGEDQFIGQSTTELSFKDSPAGVVIDLGAGTAVQPGGTDSIVGINRIIGSAHDDTFRGSSGADFYNSGGRSRDSGSSGDRVSTGAGADWVEAYGGTVDLGPGDDGGTITAGTIAGGEGDDSVGVSQLGTALGGPGRDDLGASVDQDDPNPAPGPIRLDGGAGNDMVKMPIAYAEHVSGDCPRLCARSALDGGSGTDVLDVRYARRVVVDLRAGSVRVKSGRSSIAAVENVSGSRGRDVIRGDARANRFDGNGGDDLLVGRSGPDRLYGGPGRDRAEGGPGRDRCVAERKSSC